MTRAARGREWFSGSASCTSFRQRGGNAVGIDRRRRPGLRARGRSGARSSVAESAPPCPRSMGNSAGRCRRSAAGIHGRAVQVLLAMRACVSGAFVPVMPTGDLRHRRLRSVRIRERHRRVVRPAASSSPVPANGAACPACGGVPVFRRPRLKAQFLRAGIGEAHRRRLLALAPRPAGRNLRLSPTWIRPLQEGAGGDHHSAAAWISSPAWVRRHNARHACRRRPESGRRPRSAAIFQRSLDSAKERLDGLA